jgi:hypothetical protein
VADTFDALTSTRAYRPAKRHRDVFRILREEAGTQLDPLAVQAFSRCYSGFWGIAAWSIVSGAPQRLLFPLGSQAPVAGGTLTAKALAALAAATAATGGLVSGSSLTDPRDASAGPTGMPALAAVGAGARGVEYVKAERSTKLPARGDGQGGNPPKAGLSGGAVEDGSRPDAPGPGDPPSGNEPEPPPDPGGLPGTDSVPKLGNPRSHPGQPVEQQLQRLEEQAGQLRETSGQLQEQLGDQLGQLG